MRQNAKEKKDISLDIEFTRDKEHMQKFNERIMAYLARISKLQEEKVQE